MATLYEISNELMSLVESAVDAETGEINEEVANQIMALEEAKADKIEGIALWIKNLKADAKAYAEEEANFKAKKTAAENKAESLKGLLTYALAGEKFKTTKVNISYRKSESVDYTDIKIVPSEYIRYKDPEVDKVGLKAALKMGANIPGCSLVEKQSIQIK